MPRIVTLRTKDQFNADAISLVLSQDAVTVGPNGDPWCGVTLSSERARSLDQRFFNIATEIEHREDHGSRTSSLSLIHLCSVGVVHDGSDKAIALLSRAPICKSVIGNSRFHGNLRTELANPRTLGYKRRL